MTAPLTTASGLWTGVDDSTDPEDDTPQLATGAVNGYFPDPASGCAFYSRPGLARFANIPVSTGQPQGVYQHTGSDGTVYNFLFENGVVYRQNTDLVSVPTVVTPTGINIATGTGVFMGVSGPRIYCCSLGDNLIVNDGVNKPWIGTNLGNTPITGTTIDLHSPTNSFSRGSTDTNLANTTFTYSIFVNSMVTAYSFAANAVGTALGALGTIPNAKWGIIAVYFSSSAATTMAFRSGANNYSTGYNTEALAIAALPAIAANEYLVGYVTVLATASGWVAGTDAFAGGASGHPATTTNYYAGWSSPWVAFGKPVIYTGAVVFVLRSDALTNSPTTIVWCEPNQPNVGYLQTNYADFFTLTQTGSSPVYCLCGSNVALYYSRDLSWGSLQGPPNLFTNNTTQDTISTNEGCVAPGTVVGFGNYVYFNDAQGRTKRFALGTTTGCEPLWLQARAAYDTQTAAGNCAEANISAYSWSVIEPNLNLLLTGAYPDTTQTVPTPSTIYCYDAVTGRYCGTWVVGSNLPFNCAGVLRDVNNQPAMVWLQAPDAFPHGYCWYLTRAAANTWKDNNVTVVVSLNTARLAYSSSLNMNVVAVRALTLNVTPVALTTITTTGSTSVGTQTPPTSSDGTFRAVWITDGTVNGRGVICSVGPTTTTSQWQLFKVEIDYTQNIAPAGDP